MFVSTEHWRRWYLKRSVVLKRRGIAPAFVPPISVVFAGARAQCVAGLTRFRNDGDEGVSVWIEHFAIEQLVEAGVLVPLSSGQRNRSWEAFGLLDLIGQLESGEYPAAQ